MAELGFVTDFSEIRGFLQQPSGEAEPLPAVMRATGTDFANDFFQLKLLDWSGRHQQIAPVLGGFRGGIACQSIESAYRF